MKKVIWYMHQYAGAPGIGMSYRPYYLTREFRQLGYKAYVIAANFHHLLDRQVIQREVVRYETINTVPYLWLKTPSYHNNGIKRIYNMFAFAWALWRHRQALVAQTGRPDVIICSSVPPYFFLVARKLAQKYKAKLIFEIRDLWPLSLVEALNLSPRHPFVILTDKIVKKAYRKADNVVCVLPNAKAYLVQQGMTADKFIHIPNGIATDVPLQIATNPIGDDPQLRRLYQLKQQNKFMIAYIGAHGVPNALEQFIDAMLLLAKDKQAHIYAVLIGKGLLKSALQKKAKDVDNITFFDPVPKPAVPAYLAAVDAAFIGWRDLSLYQHGVSANKIFDYMLAGKPIIHAIAASADPVQFAQCGIIVPPEQPEQLAQAFQKLAQKSAAELAQMGQRGKDYVIKFHDYAYLARQYSQLFA